MGGKERQSCLPYCASDWEISAKGRMGHSMDSTTKSEGLGMRTITEYAFGVLLSVLLPTCSADLLSAEPSDAACIYEAYALPAIA